MSSKLRRRLSKQESGKRETSSAFVFRLLLTSLQLVPRSQSSLPLCYLPTATSVAPSDSHFLSPPLPRQPPSPPFNTLAIFVDRESSCTPLFFNRSPILHLAIGGIDNEEEIASALERAPDALESHRAPLSPLLREREEGGGGEGVEEGGGAV